MIDHDEETGKILTLEATNVSKLNGAGWAQIGNLRDVLNPGPKLEGHGYSNVGRTSPESQRGSPQSPISDRSPVNPRLAGRRLVILIVIETRPAEPSTYCIAG